MLRLKKSHISFSLVCTLRRTFSWLPALKSGIETEHPQLQSSTENDGSDGSRTIKDIFHQQCLKKAHSIPRDRSHPARTLFSLLKSGRYRSPSASTVRPKDVSTTVWWWICEVSQTSHVHRLYGLYFFLLKTVQYFNCYNVKRNIAGLSSTASHLYLTSLFCSSTGWR